MPVRIRAAPTTNERGEESLSPRNWAVAAVKTRVSELTTGTAKESGSVARRKRKRTEPHWFTAIGTRMAGVTSFRRNPMDCTRGSFCAALSRGLVQPQSELTSKYAAARRMEMDFLQYALISNLMRILDFNTRSAMNSKIRMKKPMESLQGRLIEIRIE